MIICHNCGHENPDDPQFCADCGEYLPWDESTRDTRDTRPTVERGAGMSVNLIAEDLRVAGGEEVQCQLQVRNTGKVVDHYTVTVLGLDDAWVEIDPVVVKLSKNVEGSATITIRPPRSSEAAAGRIPFTVQVTSRADTELVETVAASLILAPFSSIRPELIPRTSEGRRVGEHRLRVANAGNDLLLAGLDVRDPDQRLRVAVRPRRLEVPAGRWVEARIEVRPRRPRLLGQPVTYPFQVLIVPEVAPGNGEVDPTVVEGAMVQRALLPTWVIPVAAGLVTLAAGLAVLAAPDDGPPPPTTATAPPTTLATTTTAPTTTIAPPTSPSIIVPPPGDGGGDGGGGGTTTQSSGSTTSSPTTSTSTTTSSTTSSTIEPTTT
jgi:hypothetical protein